MLIVNPNNRLRSSLAAIEPPLWAGLTASYLKADILDAEALDLTLIQTEEKIRASGQKDILIVVMGNNPSVSSTPKMPVAEALADHVNDLNVSITGLHPIAVNYDKYPVIIKPFEGFPMMPWGELPMEKYRAHNWHCLDGSSRSPYASIYTSLGCPFNCYYCNVHTLYGSRAVQFRPIKDVMKEVDILVSQYGVRNIKIWDELFTLKEDRVLEICSGLKNYNLNMWAYARVDCVSERILEKMKEAGINWLAYGFETADAWGRNKIINKNTSQEQTEKAIRMTRSAGINIIANFMLGLPNIIAEDDWRTLAWAKKHQFEFINVYNALPYPGSKWYEELMAAANTSPSYNPGWSWEQYDQYRGGFAFRSDYDSANPLSRTRFFNEYFTNPPYLEMIAKKFGEGGVSLIKEMLQSEYK